MMRIEVLRRLLWRRRVKAARAWRDAERAQYQRAVERITATEPTGQGTRRQPRS